MRALCLLSLIATALSANAQALFEGEEDGRVPRRFDIVHYALDLTLDEQLREVRGTTSILLTARSAPIDSVTLDAVGMVFSSAAFQSGEQLRYRADSQSVTIRFPAPVGVADTVAVVLDYSCRPERGLYFIQPDSTDRSLRWQIWTQGEESDNRYWFPCYDAPDDKATSEVTVTVREAYTVLSNGSLVGVRHDPQSGTRTYHWRQEQPHSSYLIMLVAGVYSILEDGNGRVPVYQYVYPEDSARAAVVFRNTRAIVEFLEKASGYPYPWEKYSQVIIDRFMYGGMENTSAVTLNDAYMYDERAALDFSSDPVIAHEAAHQWWGDLVTCTDWSHLWLNEGFANYFESLYKRSADGIDADLVEAEAWARSVRAVDAQRGRKPVVSHESYTPNLYNKGAWALRMLSRVIGEEALLTGLSRYASQFAFQAVTTDDLIGVLEESTGEELSWFFDQWIYGTGFPELTVEKEWDSGQRMLRLTVRQEQETDSLTGLFRFPVDIEITTPSTTQEQSVWITGKEHTFTIPLDEEPEMVLFDSGLHVLKSLRFDRTKRELLFQLRNARYGIDRIEAIEALGPEVDDVDVFTAIAAAAQHDPFPDVRRKATEVLATADSDELPGLLFDIYRDRKAAVRNAAVRGLEPFNTPEVIRFLEQAADTDSSYYVLASCIRTLAAIDPAEGFRLAQRYVDLDSHRDIVRRTALGAFRTSDDPSAVGLAIPFTAPTYERSARRMAVSVIRELGSDDAAGRSALWKLIVEGTPDLRIAAVEAVASWEDEIDIQFLRSRERSETDPGVLESIRKALEELE